MPFVLLLGWLMLSLPAAAQHDPARRDAPSQGDASAGASGDAARARAGSNASVEGGAALGATGIDSRPAVKTEQAEKQARRDRAKARASAGATRDSRPGSREAEESR
jgi:hypothetical protein